MKKIRMAVIGAGVWGETHASIYNEHPFAEMVAICDLNGSKAQVVAEKYGIPEVYSDYKEMLKKSSCDAVAIVTPDFLHAEIAIACVNAGKHILIEKPLATTKKDVFEIVEVIRKSKIRAMVDFHNRWSPPFNSVKRIVESGSLGKPVSAYFRLNDTKWVATDMLPWAAKSSILWFLGSHSLDTLRWIFNDEPKEIYAIKSEGILRKLGVNTVDMYMSTIKFRNGAIAQMENGWITPNGNPCVNDIKFNILCEKGKIDINASNHNLIQVVSDEKLITEDVLVKNFVFDRCKGFAYESIRSFIDRLIDGKEFNVTLKDAANTSLAILAIFKSTESGMPVKPELI